MADAYKVKADTSLPRAIREASELADGTKVYETEGRNYAAGSYVLASDLHPRDRERAANGDLDHLLEASTVEEAEAAQNAEQYGVFIPEHEAESVVLNEYGHEIVPRDQVLELKSAGADAASTVLEKAKSEGLDERPNLTAAEVPSLAAVSRGDALAVVPEDSQHVAEEDLVGVEQPPGVPVGADKAAAEGADEVKPRQRPTKARKAEAAAEKTEEKDNS